MRGCGRVGSVVLRRRPHGSQCRPHTSHTTRATTHPTAIAVAWLSVKLVGGGDIGGGGDGEAKGHAGGLGGRGGRGGAWGGEGGGPYSGATPDAVNALATRSRNSCGHSTGWY